MEAGQKGVELRVNYERFGAWLHVKDALLLFFLFAIFGVLIKLFYTLSASVISEDSSYCE